MRSVGRAGKVVIAIASAASLITSACTKDLSSGASAGHASATPAATASPSSPPLVQEGGAPLGPGTYSTVFQPKVTFTTDASWVSYADTADFVQFERADGSGSIAFTRIDKVFDPAGAHKLLPVPKDYIGWIVTLPGAKVLAGPKAFTIDGVAATEIDATATKEAPTFYCEDPCVALWTLGRHADFIAGLRPDGVSRIVAIRLHGETVEISCGASVGDFAALAKDFDVIIQSVHFG
jgi:hypothetical protein